MFECTWQPSFEIALAIYMCTWYGFEREISKNKIATVHLILFLNGHLHNFSYAWAQMTGLIVSWQIETKEIHPGNLS